MAINFLSGIDVDNGVLYTDTTNNRVGIGTTSPTEVLDVRGNVHIETGSPSITLKNTAGFAQDYSITNSSDLVIEKNGTDGGGNFIIKDENDLTPFTVQMSAASPDIVVEGNLVVKDKTGTTTNLYVKENNGNVGIGTTSPSYKLDVVKDSNNAIINLERTGTNSGKTLFSVENQGRLRILSDDRVGIFTNSSERIRIEAGGNVGIGTTSPARKLEVYNGSSSMISQFRSGSGTSSFICFANTGSTADQVRIGSISTNLVLSTNYTERMRIDSSGNVGIGTTSPSAKLHVDDGDVIVKNDSTDQYKWQYGSNQPVWSVGGGNYFTIKGGGNRFVTLNSSGNFGIGTTSPLTKLNLADSSSGAILSFKRSNSTTSGAKGGLTWVDSSNYYVAGISASGDGTTDNSGELVFRTSTGEADNTDLGYQLPERMRIDSSGNVGIGTTSPAATLDVTGSGLGAKIHSSQTTGLQVSGGGNSQDIARFQNVSGSTKVTIDHAGNVGIGTTSPTSLLTLESNSSSPYAGIDIKSTAYYPGSKIRFLNSSGSEVSTIESYNNPGRQDITVRYTGSSTGGKVELQDNAAILAAGTSAAQSYAQVGVTDFRVITNYGTRMYINTLGYVGVNETSPNARLQVKESSITTFTGTGSSAQLRLRGGYTTNEYIILGFSQDSSKDIGRMAVKRGSSGSSFHWGVSTNYGNGITNEAMILNHQGRLGINNLTPSYLLDVGGDGRVNGTLTCVTLVQTSQRDQKKDIADIDKTKAKAIPFKEYKYKSSIDGSERKRYGVVAEDIENDYPELVHTGADGIKGINYIDLLVKRVAELEKELEDISLTPGPKGDKGDTGAQGPAGANGTNGKDGANGNDHLKNVQSIAFNEKTRQLEITIEGHKDPFKFNPAK